MGKGENGFCPRVPIHRSQHKERNNTLQKKANETMTPKQRNYNGYSLVNPHTRTDPENGGCWGVGGWDRGYFLVFRLSEAYRISRYVVSFAAVFWAVTQRSPQKERLLTSEPHSFPVISQLQLGFIFKNPLVPNSLFETRPIRARFLSLYRQGRHMQN